MYGVTGVVDNGVGGGIREVREGWRKPRSGLEEEERVEDWVPSECWEGMKETLFSTTDIFVVVEGDEALITTEVVSGAGLLKEEEEDIEEDKEGSGVLIPVSPLCSPRDNWSCKGSAVDIVNSIEQDRIRYGAPNVV